MTNISLDKKEIPRYLDVSAVQTSSTRDDVLACAQLAHQTGALAVFVLPAFLPVLFKERERLGGKFFIGSTVGFPSGQSTTAMKVAEAKQLVEFGVDEVDMVANVGFLLSGMFDEALSDIKAVKEAVGSIPLKVIIETPLLDDATLHKATEIVLASGAEWIKTGTGWTKTPTTMDHVRTIRGILGPDSPLKFKVAGGVRSVATIEEMFTLYGVRRFGIGLNSVRKIMEEIG